MPPLQRTKSIADGQRSAMAIASCPAPLGRVSERPLHRLHRLAQYLLQSAIAGGGGNAVKLFRAKLQLAMGGNRLCPRQQRLEQRLERLVVRSANIQSLA
ncbi:Uncharacterised protein [Klebsiella oxytoca]|nr:Uncharacterised protein [Klebsiella oxytoca]